MARTTGNASDLITFTRASTGTFLGSNGLLQTAAINTPRVEYDANGVAKGLLIEEARTNLVASSLVFTSAPGPHGMTVTSSLETAPDGTTSASLCTATGTAIHRVRNSITVTASGVTYSTSLFVKNVDADYIQIHNSGDLEYYANFDIANGAVGTTGSKTTSTITAYPNGWYRITASYDGTGVMNAVANIAIITSASAGFGENANKPGTQVHMWGFQREQGNFPTSYIPTSGATATRSADIASVSVSEFGYNDAQGTMVIDYASDDDVMYVASIRETNQERWLIYRSVNLSGYVASPTAVTTNMGAPSNTSAKVAISIDGSSMQTVLDGGTVQSNSLGRTPAITDTSTLDLGHLPPSSFFLNGHIKSINYYPLRLSDAKLQELTS